MITQQQKFLAFERAANLGDPLTLVRLGRCYMHGEGTTKNGARAVECFKLAATQGNIDAWALFYMGWTI